MPHVIVKMFAGRTREQKQELADALTKTLMDVLKSKESSISVGIEDVEPADWQKQVLKPEVLDKPSTIYKHTPSSP